MSALTMELQAASLVLVGRFNPSIFQPAWFAKMGLVSEEEARSAKIEIITSQLSLFDLGDWLRVQVTENRFSGSTKQEPQFEPLRDLVLGTFQSLRHTPVTKLGINREFHFGVEDLDQWHQVGDRLVPKDIWNAVLRDPGMRTLRVTSLRPDNYGGEINVTVEPSARTKPGVFLGVNDHFELEPAGQPLVDAEPALKVLKDNWDESIRRSVKIAEEVLRRCLDD